MSVENPQYGRSFMTGLKHPSYTQPAIIRSLQPLVTKGYSIRDRSFGKNT